MGNCCYGLNAQEPKNNEHQVRRAEAEREAERMLHPVPHRPENVVDVIPEPLELDRIAADVVPITAPVYNPLVYNPLVNNPDHRFNPVVEIVEYTSFMLGEFVPLRVQRYRHEITQGDFMALDIDTTMPCGIKNQFYC